MNEFKHHQQTAISEMTESTRIDLLDSIKHGTRLIRLRSTKAETTAIKSLQNQIVPIDRWPLLVCKRRFRVPRQVAEQLLIQQTALLLWLRHA